MSTTPGTNAGASFAKMVAPYIKYLEAVDDWLEANEVKLFLHEAARDVADHQDPRLPNQTARTLASILDICRDVTRASSTTHASSSLKDSSLCKPNDGAIDSDAVNRFLKDLHECRPDTHTRIIVLHGPDDHLKSRALLLFCHILGIELDLEPAYVCMLAQGFLNDYTGTQWSQPSRTFPRSSRMRRHQLRGRLASRIHFGMSKGQCTFAAAALGRFKIGNNTPHLVVVSLQSLFDGPDLNSAGLLGEPPAPSRLLSAQPSAKTPIDPEPHDLFVHTMQQFLKETAPLDPDTSSGCWLAALVHMQATSRADAVDHVLDWHQLPDPSPDEMAAMKRHHAEQLTLLAASLTDSIDQVSFFRRYRPDVRSADYEKAVAMMERLLQQVSRELKHIEYGLEVRFRVQSMEASNLTIKEGHSAVALTVLAFVFIPINLASSVYGMNVQEINDTGHKIWVFVVTSIVFLILSGLVWVWRHVLKELFTGFWEILGFSYDLFRERGLFH